MIAILLADGFEEIEALTPVDILRRAGYQIKTVGTNGKIAVGSHSIPIVCDLLLSEIVADEIEMLILPGGMPGAKNLDASPEVDALLRAVYARGKKIGAICAAPFLLGKRGFLKGKRAVCFPGFENQLEGAEVLTCPAVTDGNITTGRGMGAATDFALALLASLKGKDAAADMAKGVLYANYGK